MNPQNDDTTVWIWTALASFAGSITSLSFRPFQSMKKSEIFLAVFVGTSFAVFVSPFVIGDRTISVRVTGAICYLMATGSNILVPLAIKKMRGFLGYRDEEEPKS